VRIARAGLAGAQRAVSERLEAGELMKYAVLVAALVFGVPILAMAAAAYSRVRNFLFAAMIFATVLGAHGAVNLVSRELYRGPDRGFEITAVDLACWALVAALAIRFPSRIQWVPRGSLLMLAFFLYACMVWAMAPEALYGAFTLWKCIRIYLLYWCTVNCLRIGVPREYVWGGYAAAASVIVALSVVQKYLFHIYRIPATFDHSNTVPLYSNLLLPVLMIWGLRDTRRSPLRAALSVCLSLGLLFAVVCTFSRVGILLSAMCVGGAMVWTNLRVASSRLRIASAALAVLLFAGAVRAAIPIIERFRTAPEASEAARDEFNYAASLILADHPLGVGLNNFSYVLTSQQKYREHFRAMANEEQAGVAHHIYWLTAAEMGYIGLLLYLAIIVRFGWAALAGALRWKTPEATLVFGVFLGLIALQASGFYEWAFRVTPVTQLFGISAALAAVWSVGGRASARAGLQSRSGVVLRTTGGAKAPRGLKPAPQLLFEGSRVLAPKTP
jgi:O-antigen ligase